MTRFAFPISIACLTACLFLTGCASDSKAPDIEHVMLPTREVQATFPAEFKKAHETALRCVRDQLAYTVSASRVDVDTGRGRIDGTLAGGGSVRIESERGRELNTTQIRVFAVSAGSQVGDVDAANDILDRIGDSLAPQSK